MIADLFDKKKAKEKRWRFVQEDLNEVTDELRNPARGWYQIYTFLAEQEPDFEAQRWCLDTRDTLALVLIDIGSYRKRDLDRAALDRIHRILRFFEENQYDCIVRAVYDHEGKAFVREPVDFAQVQTHMRQIGSVIRECASSIFVFQGILLGNWGEMHGSRFFNDERMILLADILRVQKAPQTFLAVRRPVYWRRLHGGQKQKTLNCSDGMGLFDDGIFGSASHLGTFDEEGTKKRIWEEPWCRDAELEFEHRLCDQVPNGGEAVYNSGYIKALTPEQAAGELKKMQVTYLNRAHDARILNIWKEWTYPGQGVWAGKSVFDYVGAHLGYRFIIRNVRVSQIRREGRQYRVEVEIENTGFGGFYQEAEMNLEYVDRHGLPGTVVLEDQMKGWKSGEKRRLSCMAEAGRGQMTLSARRKQDGAKIRFAHQSGEEGKTVLGYLNIEC